MRDEPAGELKCEEEWLESPAKSEDAGLILKETKNKDLTETQ